MFEPHAYCTTVIVTKANTVLYVFAGPAVLLAGLFSEQLECNVDMLINFKLIVLLLSLSVDRQDNRMQKQN